MKAHEHFRMLAPRLLAAGAMALFACGDLVAPDEGEVIENPTGLLIDTVSPSSGPISGATSVTVVGTGFVPGDTRVLLGGVAALDVEVLSPTTLVFRTPRAAQPGEVGITVFNANGFGAESNVYTYQPLLELSGSTPFIGHAAGGTVVTLSGSGFLDTNPGPLSVKLDDQAIDFEIVDDATLEVTMPPGTEWTSHSFSVQSRNGAAELTNVFTYMLPGLLGIDTSAGLIFHIDPVTTVSTAIEETPLNRAATSMEITPDGRLFVAHRGHSPDFNTHVAEVRLGKEEETLVGQELFTRVGGMALADNGDLLLVSRNFSEGVIRINPDTSEIVSTVPLPVEAQGNCRGCAIAVDPAGRVFGAFQASNGPLYELVNGSFVAGPTIAHPVPNNIKSMTFAGPVLLAIHRGGGAGGAGVAPGGGGGSETLIRIDVNTGEITELGALPSRLDALATIPLAPDQSN